jgi:hypothetical protein
MHDNGGLDIDLGGDGLTANDGRDADAGPNGRQNFATLTRVEATSDVHVVGTFAGAPSTSFQIDLYTGDRWLGTVPIATDGAGQAAFDVQLPVFVSAGATLRATATNAAGGTSELSPAVKTAPHYVIDSVRETLISSPRQRVLMYHGLPLRLVGYGDYGILAEPGFDYHALFDQLAANHVNLARVWLSYHCAKGLSPFARDTANPSLYDLTRFDDAYFERLRDLVSYARTKGIMVQLTLFNASELISSNPNAWNYSPYNDTQNVQNYLKSPADFAISHQGPIWQNSHLPLIRKTAATLGNFDNVIYEVMNEPTEHATDVGHHDFHDAVVDALSDALADMDGSKLISVNVTATELARALAPATLHSLARWALSDPRIGLLSVHATDLDLKTLAKTIAELRNSPLPMVVSNDGDLSQMTYAQAVARGDTRQSHLQGAGRAARLDAYLRAVFMNEGGRGHMHFEFLDKGLNGASWLSTSIDYQPALANVDGSILTALSSAAVGAPGGATPVPPDVAGNDPDDTLKEADAAHSLGRLVAGKSLITQVGRIAVPGDVDVFSFRVKAGDVVGFTVDTAGGSGARLDVLLRLFGPNGKLLSANDAAPAAKGGGLNAHLQYRFTRSGTYYVGVSAAANGAYDVLTGAGDRTTGAHAAGSYLLSIRHEG